MYIYLFFRMKFIVILDTFILYFNGHKYANKYTKCKTQVKYSSFIAAYSFPTKFRK